MHDVRWRYSWYGHDAFALITREANSKSTTYEIEGGDLPPLNLPRYIFARSIILFLIFAVAIGGGLIAANKQRRGRAVIGGAFGPDGARRLPRFLRGRREEVGDSTLCAHTLLVRYEDTS